jgi:hypothetical protein
MASIELRSKLEPQKRIPGRSLGEPMNSMPAASKEPLAADFRIETFSRAFTRLVAAILDVSFDDLWGREQRRKKTHLAVLSVTSLALVTVLAFH